MTENLAIVSQKIPKRKPHGVLRAALKLSLIPPHLADAHALRAVDFFKLGKDGTGFFCIVVAVVAEEHVKVQEIPLRPRMERYVRLRNNDDARDAALTSARLTKFVEAGSHDLKTGPLYHGQGFGANFPLVGQKYGSTGAAVEIRKNMEGTLRFHRSGQVGPGAFLPPDNNILFHLPYAEHAVEVRAHDEIDVVERPRITKIAIQGQMESVILSFHLFRTPEDGATFRQRFSRSNPLLPYPSFSVEPRRASKPQLLFRLARPAQRARSRALLEFGEFPFEAILKIVNGSMNVLAGGPLPDMLGRHLKVHDRLPNLSLAMMAGAVDEFEFESRGIVGRMASEEFFDHPDEFFVNITPQTRRDGEIHSFHHQLHRSYFTTSAAFFNCG